MTECLLRVADSPYTATTSMPIVKTKKYVADPRASKRPLSAYFIFVCSICESIMRKMGWDTLRGNKKNRENISTLDKDIGKIWRAMTKLS